MAISYRREGIDIRQSCELPLFFLPLLTCSIQTQTPGTVSLSGEREFELHLR